MARLWRDRGTIVAQSNSKAKGLEMVENSKADGLEIGEKCMRHNCGAIAAQLWHRIQ
jgi:hypothetical protein